MASKNEVRAAVVCHKGCVRSNNEDNFFLNGDFMSLQDINKGAVIEHTFNDACQVYGVFDGMGGGDWGERASTIAAQMMQSVYSNMSKLDATKLMKNYAYKTNNQIVEDGRSHNVELQGTTMATLMIKNGMYHCANVGDSRVYLIRNQRIKQLSMDHSMVGEWVREGRMTAEQARKSPDNNVITHYLGMRSDDLPHHLVAHIKDKLKPGDRFMLCSDGLSDLLSETAIKRRMATIQSPLNCARQLVMDALEMGGKDNTTCVVLDYGAFTPVSEETLNEAKKETASQPEPKNEGGGAEKIKEEQEETTALLTNASDKGKKDDVSKKAEDEITSLL